MANFIEATDFRPIDGFVNATSRYADATIIYYGNLRKLTYTTYKKTDPNMLQQPQKGDIYSIIPPGWEYRPDLASRTMYGTVDFWWKILEANDMKDVWEFKAGKNIRLPINIYGI